MKQLNSCTYISEVAAEAPADVEASPSSSSESSTVNIQQKCIPIQRNKSINKLENKLRSTFVAEIMTNIALIT